MLKFTSEYSALALKKKEKLRFFQSLLNIIEALISIKETNKDFDLKFKKSSSFVQPMHIRIFNTSLLYILLSSKTVLYNRVKTMY